MGKKGKERERREHQQIRWYQWEFLRRNPDYRKDHEEFMATFGPWFEERGFWYELQRGSAKYTDHDKLFYYNRVWPALEKLCGKWCISDPFPPDWKFDGFGYYAYAFRRRVSLPTGFSSEDAAFIWHTDPVEFVGGKRHGPFTERFRLQNRPRKKDKPGVPDPRFLVVRVDVTGADNELVARLMSEVRVRRDQLLRAKSMSTKKATRRRLDQYSDYISVWDSRQSGKSFPEVARELFPKLYRRYPARKNPIEQRVRDYFRRATALISGGYKELA
jgi:hypothetical protein